MLSCIYHNIDNQQRDRCVATRGSFELLHSVVYIYIETKHGGIYIHCVLVMRTSLGSPYAYDASVGQFKTSITKFLCCAICSYGARCPDVLLGILIDTIQLHGWYNYYVTVVYMCVCVRVCSLVRCRIGVR